MTSAHPDDQDSSRYGPASSPAASSPEPYGPASSGYGPGPTPGYGPGPYSAPGYGYGPGYGEPPPYRRRGGGMATAALVLGIIALLSCWTVFGGIVLGLVAVILGAIAFRRARRGEAEGQGRALAGIITGALGILLAAGLLALGISVVNSPGFRDFQSCVQHANGDQAAVQECQRQFQGRYTK